MARVTTNDSKVTHSSSILAFLPTSKACATITPDDHPSKHILCFIIACHDVAPTRCAHPIIPPHIAWTNILAIAILCCAHVLALQAVEDPSTGGIAHLPTSANGNEHNANPNAGAASTSIALSSRLLVEVQSCVLVALDWLVDVTYPCVNDGQIAGRSDSILAQGK